jgi:hypothetical protein
MDTHIVQSCSGGIHGTEGGEDLDGRQIDPLG